jgi:hypothetical protein
MPAAAQKRAAAFFKGFAANAMRHVSALWQKEGFPFTSLIFTFARYATSHG